MTLGALSLTGIEECRTPFEPLAIPTTHVSSTSAYRHPDGADENRFCAALLAEVEAAIEAAGPETVAMLIAEPVQNAGGCIVPPARLLGRAARDLRPPRRSCSAPTR